ncbi:MAG: hypothetical protein FJ279_11535, partial [Planctomycetes bacterium]|nr:hypothetical protein [Planctomycetota bacterium]
METLVALRRWSWVLLAVASATCGWAERLPLDPGGTAFPYPERRRIQAAGENVVPDPSFETMELKKGPPGWFVGFHVYTPPLDAEKGEKVHARVAPTVEMKLATGRARTGDRSVYLRIPGSAWRQGDLNFSARLEGTIPLPQDFASFAVQFAYRMQAEPPATGNGRVMVHFLDEKGQPVVHWQQFRLNPAPDWTLRTLPFKLDKAARKIGVTFYLDGCGTAEYDDLAIFPVALDEEPISIRCVPMQFLDGAFALSEGDTALIQFGLKGREKKPAALDAHLFIAAPEGVRFISWHGALRLADTRPHEARLLHDFAVSDLGQFIGTEHDTLTGIVLLMQTDLKAGTRLPPMLYWIEYAPGKDQPKVKTQPASLNLTVLPPIRGRTPKDFVVGAMLRKPTRNVGDGPSVKPYAEFIKRCGVNCLPGATGATVARYGQELGIPVLSESGVANGYMLGWITHPKEWAFIRADGEAFPRGLCPTVIVR